MQTPVWLALYKSLHSARRKRGRPCLTWIKITEKYLVLVDIKLHLNNKAPDETIPILVGLVRMEACG